MESVKWVAKKGKIFWPSKEMKRRAWVSDEKIYKLAEKNPVKFWEERASEGLSWFKKWRKAYEEKLPYFKWFVGGKLNACYNAVDRNLETKSEKPAIIWEPEPLNEKNRMMKYKDLHREVNKFANVLKKLGVKKGDRVGIYLPMIPEVVVAMLACARIGAPHTVVFSAFSSDALKARLLDAQAKILITADGYYRRGKIINLKEAADNSMEGTAVKHVVVVRRAKNKIIWNKTDKWWHELMKKAKPVCKTAVMDSEDMLFLLYTSGSTGKPKGVVHTTGGYLTQAYWTAKWDFDLHDDDVMWCTADIGWVTGHTYNCYGPLSNGATIVMFEGVPDFPNPDRWWQIVEKHGVTVFYTAPTAIRMLMRLGDQWVRKHNLKTLRILGTVGEPINEEAWMWYFKTVGGGRCPVIDTWWQTETGGTLINALPGIGPFIPTVAGRIFPGTRLEVLTEKGKIAKNGEEGNLVQLRPFAPGMLRGVWKNPEKFLETYWKEYGKKIYFTSDGAWRDKNGMFRLTGRVDDVMKVAGHRLSTAELENAIDLNPSVAECAVVPMKHEIKGEVPIAFVVMKHSRPSEELVNEINKQVEKTIGPIARPHRIIFVIDLPKTRSGKIMRRILKKIIVHEDVGDVSTLANPECVEKIKNVVG